MGIEMRRRRAQAARGPFCPKSKRVQCYVYISPVESTEMAANCDGDELSTVWGVNVSSSYIWVIP